MPDAPVCRAPRRCTERMADSVYARSTLSRGRKEVAAPLLCHIQERGHGGTPLQVAALVRLVQSAMDSTSGQSPTASASADAMARAALERYAALPVHCKPTAAHEWTVLAAFVLEDRVAGILEVRWGLRWGRVANTRCPAYGVLDWTLAA